MFRRSINQFYLALIKPNKPKTDYDLTLRSISDCRELLGMPSCQASNIEEKARGYLKQRAEFVVQKLNADAVYKNWHMFKPIQCQIGVLAFSERLTSLQSTYLYKVFSQWGKFFINEQAKVSSGTAQLKQSYRKALIDFALAFSSTCYLLDLDQNMVQIYLKIYYLSQAQKMEDKSYSHLRYVLDHLLKLKKIPEKDLDFMLVFTSRFPIQSVYHQKEKQILNLIYSSLPKFKSQKKYHIKLLNNLLHNISIQSQISGNMKSLVLHIYNNFSNPYLRFRAFCTLSDIFIINKDNISEDFHVRSLKLFMKQIPNLTFKYISKIFFRANIWIPWFWIPYFQFVSKGDNYKQIETFNHFVIDDLLAKQKVGGVQLQKAALAFRQTLKLKNIRIEQYDLRKQYEKSFGRIKQNKNSCQLHVANSMRLICSAQILTQVPIKYFMVDVLVDQKIIVEINNSHHYKVIDGVTSLNLKSQFRQRILESNGYKCYNIKVDDLSNSNYSMLEEIHKIVESSGSIKKIEIRKSNE